jgi:hypothetical protein
MAWVIEVRCDVCRRSSDALRMPHSKGKADLGYLRRAATGCGWACKREKTGHWHFTCPECRSDAKG